MTQLTAPGDPLCDACVAFALELTLEQARSLTGALAEASLATVGRSRSSATR